MSGEDRKQRILEFQRDVAECRNIICDFGKLPVAIDFAEGRAYALRAPIEKPSHLPTSRSSTTASPGDFNFFVDFALKDSPARVSSRCRLREQKSEECNRANVLSYHGAPLKCRAVFDAALYPAAPPMYVGVITPNVTHMDLRNDGQLSKRARAMLFGGYEKYTIERVRDKLYQFFQGPVHPCVTCNAAFDSAREQNSARQEFALRYRSELRRHTELFAKPRATSVSDVEGLDPRFNAMLLALERAQRSCIEELEGREHDTYRRSVEEAIDGKILASELKALDQGRRWRFELETLTALRVGGVTDGDGNLVTEETIPKTDVFCFPVFTPEHCAKFCSELRNFEQGTEELEVRMWEAAKVPPLEVLARQAVMSKEDGGREVWEGGKRGDGEKSAKEAINASAQLAREFERKDARAAEIRRALALRKSLRPNSMNKHGVVLAGIGMGETMNHFAEVYLYPIAAALFGVPGGAGSKGKQGEGTVVGFEATPKAGLSSGNDSNGAAGARAAAGGAAGAGTASGRAASGRIAPAASAASPAARAARAAGAAVTAATAAAATAAAATVAATAVTTAARMTSKARAFKQRPPQNLVGVGASLDQQHSFLVKYEALEGKDHGLDMHVGVEQRES